MNSKIKKRENKDLSKVKFLLDSLKKKNKVSNADLINLLKKDMSDEEIEQIITVPELVNRLREKKEIPVSVFNEELSALETICKFLKENLGFSIKKIAFLTHRSEKTVWQAYNSSKNKYSKKFIIEVSDYYIPVSVLKNRKYSVLESIVDYLKNLNLTYHDIALLLKRDDRTIWTTYHRLKLKKVRK